MSKHLVDIDDGALREAQAELRTSTIKDTVNEALRRAGSQRRRRVKRAFDVLAKAPVLDREQAWR
jgi:Arc/MetJ family transcription regulator